MVVARHASEQPLANVERRPPKAWAFLAQPEVIDLSTGEVHRFRGLTVCGSFYAPWMRKQLRLVTSLVPDR